LSSVYLSPLSYRDLYLVKVIGKQCICWIWDQLITVYVRNQLINGNR